ncbi:MAG: ATP synthase F1 subunit epsilon [Acidobacteria bacterium]|nr:ATP synthase F1 subunit epsilon [Acidobacteriota bacterium]
MADGNQSLSLTVVTRERQVLEAEVEEVVLPAYHGYLGVLPGHTPLLAALRVGTMTYRQGGKEEHLVIRWGFAEILPNRVIVLAEGATRPSEIDVTTAERMKAEAETELADLASHDEGFNAAQAKLEESVSMISLARRG